MGTWPWIDGGGPPWWVAGSERDGLERIGVVCGVSSDVRREGRVSRGQRGGVGRRIYYLCLCVTGRVRFDGNAKADWALV